MSNKRMIDCNFLNANGFQKLNNKSKLLYMMMITRADDKGFVDCTQEIINNLTYRDDIQGTTSLTLLNNDYVSALVQLRESGLIYEFIDKHGNMIHLIRHWFIHNKLLKGLWTNYRNYECQVEIYNNEYYFKEKETHLKEEKNKIKQNNNYHSKDNISYGNEDDDKEWNNLIEELEEKEGESQ